MYSIISHILDLVYEYYTIVTVFCGFDNSSLRHTQFRIS